MSPGKPNFLRLAGGILCFLVLLAALLFLLDLLFNQEWTRGKIAEAASALVGGSVEAQAVDLSYLPRPHLTIQGARLEIPGTATGTIRSLTAYPRLVPLLWGEVRVSELRVEAGAFTVAIPDKERTASGKEGGGPAPASLEEKLRHLLESMSRSAPGLRLVLADGRVDMSGGGLPPLSFREIAGVAVLPPAGPDLHLSCTGTLWERGSVEGRFHAKSLAGEGRIALEGFRPHVLSGHLFPGSKAGISDSDIDLDLRVETDGWAKLHAEGDVSLSRMGLYRGEKKLDLASGKLQGTLDRDGKKVTVALTRFSLESPSLFLSGNLFLDSEARRFRADAQARQVDIASLRENALALAGDFPLVKEIFSVVHAGTIPVLSFRANGESAADLGQLENMEFEGSVRDGIVTVDAGNTGLTIGKIRGDLALRRGFLEASNLEGSLGKNSARRGTFRMGFLGPDPALHLEAYVTADMSELPPLLRRLIRSESFRKELSRVGELSGDASGRLILGETLKSIKVAVTVDAMSLSGRIQGLPYPLTVSEGQLLYREEEIDVTGAKGRFGQTTFSKLSGIIRMTGPTFLEVRSGTIRLFLDELYPWAREVESLREVLARVDSASGTVALSVNSLEGKPLAPGGWRFDVSGNVERLSLEIPSVPGAIAVAEGSFRATPDTFRFENIHANLLDASVSVSGFLDGYRTGERTGAVTGGGRSGPEMIGFLCERGKIPPGFAVRPPLDASGVRMEWQKDSLVSLGGDFVIGDDVKVSVDFFRPTGEWVVRNLSVQDRDSRASLSLHWKPGSLDVAFEGLLSGETEHRIFVTDSPSVGWLKGNFRASLRLDEPMRSAARGTLEGKELHFLQRMNIPVLVEEFSLSAEDSRVAVRAAGIGIGNSRIHLEGEAAASPDGLTFDMDASTPGLDWENLREAIGTLEANEGSPGPESPAGDRGWDVPVRGTVRLRSGYFRYGRHTVAPAAAEIVFGKPGFAITITEAAYCGIPFTGTLRATSGEMVFEIRPVAKGQEIGSSYACVTMEQGQVTGRFDLAGVVSGRLREGAIPVRSLRGNLDFTARDGRIYKEPLLSRILSLLNVTDIFRRRLPDMGKEGLQYRSFTTLGEIRDGNATITAVLDGTVSMVGQGRVDLATQTYDLQILVTPTETMNAVIREIPVLGYILGGTLVQVPVRVTGTVEDPKVSLLEPAAVAENLLGIAERTFLLPVKLIRPVLPGEKNADQ